MAKCTDCIHYEPCFSGGISIWNDSEQTESDHCRHLVVRCKDCDYYRKESGKCMNPHYGTSYYGTPVKEEHFCGLSKWKE